MVSLFGRGFDSLQVHKGSTRTSFFLCLLLPFRFHSFRPWPVLFVWPFAGFGLHGHGAYVHFRSCGGRVATIFIMV